MNVSILLSFEFDWLREAISFDTAECRILLDGNFEIATILRLSCRLDLDRWIRFFADVIQFIFI